MAAGDTAIEGLATTMTMYWERVARTRWGEYISRLEENAIRGAHVRLGTPSTALDIGCGAGRWTALLADLGWSVTATDTNAKAIATCRARVPTAQCIPVAPDGRTLPCPEASVALVLCIEVPVVEEPWFPFEVARVLRPGGEVVGITTNRCSVRGAVARGASRVRTGAAHTAYSTTYRAWWRRMEAAGLQLVDLRGLCWFPFARASNSPLVPLAARLEEQLRLSELPTLSPWILFAAQSRKEHPARDGATARASRSVTA